MPKVMNEEFYNMFNIPDKSMPREAGYQNLHDAYLYQRNQCKKKLKLINPKFPNQTSNLFLSENKPSYYSIMLPLK